MSKKVVEKKGKGNSKNEKLIKLGLIIVIIVFAGIIYKLFDMLVFSNERIDLSGESYYQYFYGIMEEFSGNINVVQNEDETKLILEDGETIYLDSTPIYYKDILGKVLFAKEMEIVMPDKGIFKLSKFTNVTQENNLYYFNKLNSKDREPVDNAFIYDGEDLYFFLDEMTITMGNAKCNISPLSYAIVNYRDNVEIYDYKTGRYIIVDDEDMLQSDVLATSKHNNYTINMSVDSLSSEKSQMLLIGNVNSLKEFEY